jgi:hypothetical protein
MTAKVSGEEIGRRGQKIYESRLRTLWETEENMGKIVSIDVESGDYETGDDLVVAAAGGSLTPLVQGSPEWEERLWSLGKDSHGTALSLEATRREVIYEDAPC